MVNVVNLKFASQCINCESIVEPDQHGRCSSCGSDSVDWIARLRGDGKLHFDTTKQPHQLQNQSQNSKVDTSMVYQYQADTMHGQDSYAAVRPIFRSFVARVLGLGLLAIAALALMVMFG